MTGKLSLGQDILLCLQEQVSLPLSPLPSVTCGKPKVRCPLPKMVPLPPLGPLPSPVPAPAQWEVVRVHKDFKPLCH